MTFDAFLDSLTPSFTPVIDASYVAEDYIPVDLSPANNSLQDIDVSSAEEIGQFLKNYLHHTQKRVAYGGYLEQRLIYDRSEHFSQYASAERRNIHLGMDLWCAAGTAVLLPLDGKIHSYQHNDIFGDYGPTIIVEHLEDSQKFYTLYGHLDLESLDDLKKGQLFKKGDQIARLGDANINGNYAPHLHFQIIRDLQQNLGDYPGVCSKNELKPYSTNCPDPNLLLKIY